VLSKDFGHYSKHDREYFRAALAFEFPLCALVNLWVESEDAEVDLLFV
jgi:hypothetical protein